MSIATKTGDDGTTGLLFNRRVPKNHPRVEAYGACDELTAALGLARASLGPASPLAKQILKIQETLIPLMGELATLPGDRARYVKAGHRFIADPDVQNLTVLVDEIEREKIQFKGWCIPGDSPSSAALDMARVACRRAERRVFELGKEVQAQNPHVIRYLNRLSDLLWLMARKVDSKT